MSSCSNQPHLLKVGFVLRKNISFGATLIIAESANERKPTTSRVCDFEEYTRCRN